MRIFATIAAILALVAATSAPAAVSLSLHVDRTSLDLLDSLPIEVNVHNPGAKPQTLEFASPSEYTISIAREGKTVFDYPPSPPGADFAAHHRTFVPGPTAMVVYDWNEVARDGWSPLPGTYVVKAKLLATGAQPESSMKVSFATPLPPSVLGGLKLGQAVTIAGTLDADKRVLSDANSSLTLSRKLLAAKPGVEIVVRGYAAAKQDGSRTFTFVRWAPLGPPP